MWPLRALHAEAARRGRRAPAPQSTRNFDGTPARLEPVIPSAAAEYPAGHSPDPDIEARLNRLTDAGNWPHQNRLAREAICTWTI
jgi:hypothetical protein